MWLYLLTAHGDFWRSSPELPAPAAPLQKLPSVDIIVPARDEAETIGAVIDSLLRQDYPGVCRILVVDDGSSDATAALARVAAADAATVPRPASARVMPSLVVIEGAPKPAGWSGKLWAVEQGVRAATAPVLLFADADIVHDPRHLSALVARMDAPPVDLVSEMVRLHCSSWAECSLVPAFVYFFQMLYPFAKVNDPSSTAAAAAGGTILLRRSALQRIGGLAAIKGALIDDVSLARAVKPGGAIYLGHSALAESIRRYPRFADIWTMISRTAFTQLRYSGLLLAATLLALAVVWLVPPAAVCVGAGWQRICGGVAYVLGAASFLPTLARYRRNPLWSLLLPAIALFYMAATVGSAVNHWRGSGANWKNRSYPA